MKQKPLADAADRERAMSDIGTSLAVEAAAGAGKTSVLVARLLDLIREGEATLDRIVAVTFTEKAAGELKMRVREEIEEQLDKEQDATTVERLRRALDDLGHAPIGTIHSFCAGLLRERAVEARVDPQFQVLDELQASLLRERVWSEWLEAELARPNPALIRALAHDLNLEGQGNTIYDLAQKMLGCRDLLDGRPKAHADCPKVQDFIRGVLARLEALLWSVQADAKGDVAGRYADELEDARRTLALARLAREDSEAEAAVMRISLRKRPLGAANWKQKASAQQATQSHEALLADLADFRQKAGSSVAAGVADALVGFLDAFRQAKDDEGLLDFDDLLLLTRNMLRDSRPAREHFKGRYQFLLVDEFQDTDPLQVEIVFFLAERPGRHAAAWDAVEVEPGKLFLVGDPKQSIYRFRRADIETYERAKRALVGSHLHLARGGHVRNEDVTPGAELTLSQSFRPVPGIAEAVNAIFKDEIAPPSDGGLYQPAYVPLHPYRDAVGERAAVALVYPPPGHDEELEKMPSARRLEARCVAAMISRIIAEGWRVEDKKERAVRPARYGDIAILAERFEYSDAYAEALADADVPLRISGGRHFYMSHEVHSLVAVLKALANPHDRLSLVAALRGPFFGVSDEELLLAKCAQGTLSYLGQECGTAGQASRATAERVPVPPAFAAATAVLREFHERRDAEPTPLLLQRLYERTKVLELFLLRPRGEQRVANLLKVVVQARALEATQRVSFRSFVRWLARLHQTEAREAESASSEAGDDTVQFLSVHAAKGLEFPIVLLVDMSKDRRHANSFCVLRGRPPQDGQFAFYLGEKKAGFQTANWPGDDYERLREDAEDARRFYVAATRARDCLLLFPGWCKGAAGPARFLREAAQPEDPDWGAVTPKGLVYDTRTLDLTPPPPRAFRLAPPAAEPRSAEAQARLAARAQWQQQVAASLATATGGRVAVSPSRLEEGLTAPSDEPEATAGSGAGRRIGSLVHRCLQRSTLDDPAAVHARLHAEAKALALSAEQIQQAARLLDTALASPLLARARAAGCQHEVPFSIIVGGGVHSRRGAPVPSHARGTAGLSSSAPVREECGTAGLSSSVLGHGDTAGQASRATGILLTGAMDLLFVENGRVVVVDFKTDAVQDEAELARRADAYTPQAAAYALAARTALCKPVAEVVLFFLSQGREWRIPVTDLLLRHAAEQVQGVASSIGT